MFRETLVKQREWKQKDTISKHMAALLEDMQTTKGGHTSPRGLFKVMCSQKGFERFGNKKQEDAPELLRKLLEYWANTNKPI